MIDEDRLQIIERLKTASELAPELRFGQLIADLAFLAEGPWNETLWDLEDKALLGALDQFIHDMQARNALREQIVESE